MKKIYTFLIFLTLLSSCVSAKRYKQDMAKLQGFQGKDSKLELLEKEIATLKEKMDKREASIAKLQNQVQLLEKKISDLQKAPEKTEEIKKNQKSSYKP